MIKNEYKIFTHIWKLLNKHRYKPLLGPASTLKKSKELTELIKEFFSPLTPKGKYRYRKESLLNQTSIDYLNSVHPTKLRVNLNEAPSTKRIALKEAPSFFSTSDVVYEYLKTFSPYSKRTNGELLKYNQHIAYTFNSKRLFLREDELEINNFLKLNTNKNNSTIAAPLFNATEDTNINLNINYPLNKSFIWEYPESKRKNTPPSKPKRTVYQIPPISSQPEIPLKLRVIVNKLRVISAKAGKDRKKHNSLIKYSYKLLFYFFKSMYCLISKPVFLFTPDKVVIRLLYFINIPKFKVFKWYSIFKYKRIRKKWEALIKNKQKSSTRKQQKKKKKKIKWKVARTLIRLMNKRTKVQNILFNLCRCNLFKVFSLKFKLICEILNNKFKKPVELQLIRIHKPFLDSNILVNLLSLNIRNKKFKTNVKIEKLFQKRIVKNVYDYQNKSVNFIPTFLSGINIRIGGRLLREAIIPRRSKKKFERGARSIGKVNYLDSASVTNKNRKGSYTLKISSGQNFF